MDYLPADLSNDAYLLALKKFFAPLPNQAWNEERMEEAVYNLHKKTSIMNDSKFVSYQDAIDSLPLNTSAGMNYGTTKKQVLQDPYSRKLLRDNYNGLLLGKCGYIKPITKDELRDKQRVDAKKTRVFCPVPFEYVIEGCRLFKDQNDKMNAFSAYEPSPFLGGFNANTEAHVLATTLKEYEKTGHSIHGYDYKNFDNSHAFIFEYLAMFRILKMNQPTTEDITAICNYYGAMRRYPIMIYNVITSKPHGLLSGAFTTLSDNCIINALIIEYNKLCGHHIPYYKVFGDDNIIVGKQFISHEFMKDAAELNYELVEMGNNFDTLEFTSRKFRYNTTYNRYYLEPDVNKLRDSLRWIDKNNPNGYKEKFQAVLMISFLTPHYQEFKTKYEKRFGVFKTDAEIFQLYYRQE